MATTEIDQLKTGMAALEAQRAILGDAIVDSALGPMREKLAALEAQSRADQQRKRPMPRGRPTPGWRSSPSPPG